MIEPSVFPKKRVKISKISTQFFQRFQGHQTSFWRMESVHHGLSDDPVENRNFRTLRFHRNNVWIRPLRNMTLSKKFYFWNISNSSVPDNENINICTYFETKLIFLFRMGKFSGSAHANFENHIFLKNAWAKQN